MTINKRFILYIGLAIVFFFGNANLVFNCSDKIKWWFYDISNCLNYLFTSFVLIYFDKNDKNFGVDIKIVAWTLFIDALIEICQFFTTGNAYDGWITLIQNSMPFLIIGFFLVKSKSRQ